MISRRTILQLTGASLLAPRMAWAQSWPSQPITAIVPFSPGGASDIVARIVCEQLSTQLGQPIVVENRGGAGGTLGAAQAVQAEPDGHTILIHSISHTIAAVTYKSLPFDPIEDLSAVASLGSMANVLVVNPSSGFKSLADLVAAAKAGELSFGSAGNGTVNHLTAQRLALSAGFEAVHVPYKGAPEAITDLLAGRIDFFFSPYLPARPHLESGALVALAVASDKRAKSLPDVPTTVEQGFANTEYPYWNAVFVPAKTPREIVNRLHDEVVKAVQAADARLTETGTEPMTVAPEEMDEIVRRQIEVNLEVAKAAGVEAQ